MLHHPAPQLAVEPLYTAVARLLPQPQLSPSAPQPLMPQPVTTELLLESSTALQWPKGVLFPHLFITYGDSFKKLVQATWAEYFGAIRSLAAHPAFPLASFPAILQHKQDLANMAVTWDWAVCCRWSEKVCQMVADGCLKDGW